GRRIGYVFQEPMSALNPVLRCGDQLVETLRHHFDMDRRAARTRALEWLERVRLDEPERILRAWPHQLSGGQRQRVMLALALCAEPALLIADEPTTALDVLRQRELIELFGELRRELGFSMLFISHDLGVVRHLADEVIILDRGRVVEQGPLAQVWRAPAHAVTRALIQAMPRLDEAPWVAPAPAEEPVLEVGDLRVSFAERRSLWSKKKRHTAVDGVSFALRRGETVGIVGPSGCGKTSLARGLLRLVPATGQVRVGRTDWMALAGAALRRARRHVQLIFQDPVAALNPRLPIGEAILEPMRVHGLHDDEGERFERMQALLEEVDLPAGWHDRLPRQLSGGERQRVCIARALACQPRVLVCDECVAQLDVTIQKQVLELLLRLQQRHRLAMLFIAHDLAVVRLVSHRILVMDAGRVVEEAHPDELFRAPRSAMGRALVEAARWGAQSL
ncbi:MAG: ABC transporter ATP-binding protein, partial [Bacteroidetes bacterium]